MYYVRWGNIIMENIINERINYVVDFDVLKSAYLLEQDTIKENVNKKPFLVTYLVDNNYYLFVDRDKARTSILNIDIQELKNEILALLYINSKRYIDFMSFNPSESIDAVDYYDEFTKLFYAIKPSCYNELFDNRKQLCGNKLCSRNQKHW